MRATESLATTLFAAGVLLLVGGAGCTTGKQAGRTDAVSVAQADRHGCPLGIAGAVVTMEDTADGAMLFFTGPDVADVRERVFDVSAMYGAGKGFGKGHQGHHGEGGSHGLQAMQLPPLEAASKETEGGARLRLTAVDKADAEQLRAKVHERVAHMNEPCAP